MASRALIRSIDDYPIVRLLPALVERAELMDRTISRPEHALREMLDGRRHQAGALDAETLERYGGKVAHINAEMVETGG